MYCSSFAKLFFIVQSSLWFSEKFTAEFSAFRLALDISGAQENGEIVMWTDHGGNNQKWNFDDDLTIRSELGTVLDVKDGSRENNSQLIATSSAGREHQKFRIVPVPEWVTNIVKPWQKTLVKTYSYFTLLISII